MTQNTPGNGTGTTGSSGGSSQNSHLFVPNWSEIFPPPPQEQPPPIPSQNSSPPQTMTTTAASSRNNLFNFRQQVNNDYYRGVARKFGLGHCVLKWGFPKTYPGNQDATLK